jgi:hypothetical protein
VSSGCPTGWEGHETKNLSWAMASYRVKFRFDTSPEPLHSPKLDIEGLQFWRVQMSSRFFVMRS